MTIDEPKAGDAALPPSTTEPPARPVDDLTVVERRRVGRYDVWMLADEAGNWLVARYPVDDRPPECGGKQYSSERGECPAGPTPREMLAWIAAQPWSAEPPAGASRAS